MDSTFDIKVPWVIEDDETDLTILIRDTRLLGTDDLFLRFDLYPLYAPSHPDRHHAFWDLSLGDLSQERTVLTLKDHELQLHGNTAPPKRIKAQWRGTLPLCGYCSLHVSLWDRATNPPVQKVVKTSHHVVRPRDEAFPLEDVQIPVTQRCNLHCTMCSRHAAESIQEADISDEVLQPVLDASPGIASATLFGLGEPLLNKNLCGIVGALKKRMPGSSRVGFNTNGTLLNRSSAGRLVDVGVNAVCFSMDGATRSTYESIRLGADFDRVTRNIAYAVEYGRCSGRRDLSFSAYFVILDQNVHEIPSFVRFAASLGLDWITFAHCIDFVSWDFRLQPKEVLAPIFEEATKIGRECGIKISLPALRESEDRKCWFMQSTVLSLSGDVLPCCRLEPLCWSGPVQTFGNVLKNSLKDIWFSSEYRQFRQSVLTGDFPDVCKGCGFTKGLLAIA